MSETLTADEPDDKTYRGSSIEELLPRIRAELGPEAVIVCQREGLIGGVGGFFQKRCVEVDARPGGPGIDVYDEQDEAPGPGACHRGRGALRAGTSSAPLPLCHPGRGARR